ncbi:MAG: hypothetical protein ACRCST_17150 [Turicibacter sp.]
MIQKKYKKECKTIKKKRIPPITINVEQLANTHDKKSQGCEKIIIIHGGITNEN